MTKRLKYTKDILTHMLNNNNNKNASSTPSNGQNAMGGGSTGGISRMGTVASAVSSKRSAMSNNDMGGFTS